jgi:hypothetical protein
MQRAATFCHFSPFFCRSAAASVVSVIELSYAR